MRMKQHLGGTKQHVLMHTQRAWVSDETDPTASSNVLSLATEAKELRKQIATLQSQLAKLTSKADAPKKFSLQAGDRKTSFTEKRSSKQSAVATIPVNHKQTEKPRPWYCFKCGEDGHIASSCESESKPTLVAEKRKLLREKQSQWESQNNITKDTLN